MVSNFFGPCDQKRETRMIWNDRRKMQRGDTARKDVGLTNKATKCRTSDRCTKSDENRDAWKVMIACAKDQGI